MPSESPQPSSPSLTQPQVVAAALALIDAGGLDGFSMRNLARDLGVYPTALYWHAGNREQLLAQVIGMMLQEIDPPADDLRWDEWLSHFARGYRAALHRHPNLASIAATQMVTRAMTEIQIIDVILGKLAEAGFAGTELVDAYNVTVGCVVGFVSLELAGLPDDAQWARQMEAQIADVHPDVVPHLAANADLLADRAFGLRWSRGTEVPLDSAFELVLDVVMTGLRDRRVSATD